MIVMIAGFIIFISAVLTLVIRVTFVRNKVPSIKTNVRIVMIIISILGIVLIFIESEHIEDFYRKITWETTDAIIVDSKIVGERAIHPQVEYSYQIDTVVYRGETDLDVPMFGGKRKKYDVAREIIKGFEAGNTIKIYYNPKNPEKSYYHIAPKWNVYGKLGLGITLLILGIFFSSFPQKQLAS